MKKLILALLLGLVVLGSAFAIDDSVAEPASSSTIYYDGAGGAPMSGLIHDEVGFADKLRLAASTGSGLTIIDGALCSTFPDTEKSYTPSSESIQNVCSTNTNHIGVAFQMFEVTDTGYKFRGERQLSEGEKGCFPVYYGRDYVLHWYHCDETSRSCTNYASVASCEDTAKGGPWTIRERTCTDTGVERVTVDYWDKNAQDQQCVPPSTGGGSGADVPAGGTGGTGGSPGSLETCEGEWESIAFPSNVRPGATFNGIGKFTPTVTGECILTAHMSEDPSKALQVVNAEGSACEQPDPFYAEKRVSVTEGQTIDVNFLNMKARSNEGIYDVYVAAWTGCYVDGGQEAAATTQLVNVISATGEAKIKLAGMAGIIIAVLGVLIIIVGAVMWNAKR